jgi:ribosomal protein L21E
MLQYEKYMLSLRIKILENKISRCALYEANKPSSDCEGKKEVVHIDYNSQLQNILDDFLMSNQVSFEKFDVQCGNLVEKADECEKKLVEIEMKRHAIMVQAEHLKNKSSNIEEKPRVRRVDLYLKMETQSMGMKENIHMQEKTHSSVWWEVTMSRSLLVGAWEHLLLCAKFMEFLPNKRKKKGDIFFVSFLPP